VCPSIKIEQEHKKNGSSGFPVGKKIE